MLSAPAYGQADYEGLIQRIDSVNNFSFQEILNNSAKYETLFLEIENLADSLGYREGQAKSLEKLSLIMHYKGDWEKSIQYRMESIEIYEELGNKIEAGYAFAELGYGMRRRSHERAEYFMLKGIKMLEEFPQSEQLSNAYNNYGVIKLEKQQIDSAIYFVEKSLAIKEANNDTLGISYSYAYLGTAYNELKEYDKAVNYLQASYNLKRTLNDSAGMAIDLTNIASSYEEKRDYSSALQNYKASLNMALKIKYRHLAEHNYESLANLFETQARYDSALHYQKLFAETRELRVNEATEQKLAELEIQFETEQKEKELAHRSAELSQTLLKIRNRNWILTAMAGFLMFGGVIGFLIFRQQKIKQRENELKLQLSKAEMENKVYEERERISRDLHDNVGSQISNLITGIEISNLHLKKNQHNQAVEILHNLDTDARWAMTELRETIWLLDKDEIPFKTFLEHVKGYLNRQNRYIENLNVSVQSKVKNPGVLNSTQSLNLMRIIQEALNNTKKYAEASAFEISFFQNGDSLKINLKDDGIGFEARKRQNSGNGLTNMKKRAEDIGAEFSISSSPNKGTYITIGLPYIP